MFKIEDYKSYGHHFSIFDEQKVPKNYEKCFLFHLKSSYRFRDIQMFLFSSFPFTFFSRKESMKDKL